MILILEKVRTFIESYILFSFFSVFSATAVLWCICIFLQSNITVPGLSNLALLEGAPLGNNLTADQFLDCGLDFLEQMARATNEYGVVDESKISYRMKQLISNNTLWQQAYRLYRQNVWDHYEGNRLRDGVPCEGYDVTTSPLFTNIA